MGEQRRPEDLHTVFGMSSAEFAPTYRELEQNGYVEEYRSGGAYQWEDLVDEAEGMLRKRGSTAKRRTRAGRKPQQLRESFEIPLSDYARERAAALSEALAYEAASYPAISKFRVEVLGGGLLSPEQARDFVTSPAVRFFRFAWFKQWGIPVVGHTAKVKVTHFHVPAFDWGTLAGITSGFHPDIHSFYIVHVEPPGVEKSVLYAPQEDVRVPEGLNVDEQYYLYADPEDEFDRPSTEKVLRYFGEDGIRRARMLPGSLLDWLRQLADLLAGRYGWSQEEAVEFVLTGQLPQVQPIKASANLLTGYREGPPVWTVSLEAAPWVPAEEVRKAYYEIQKQTLQALDSGKEHLSLKKIALFRFVKEQTAGSDEEPDWQALLERWNLYHPKGEGWHYKATKTPRHQRSNFARDFREAERVLLYPEHRFPKRKVTTDLEEWQERDLQGRRRAAEAASDRIEAHLKLAMDPMDD